MTQLGWKKYLELPDGQKEEANHPIIEASPEQRF